MRVFAILGLCFILAGCDGGPMQPSRISVPIQTNQSSADAPNDGFEDNPGQSGIVRGPSGCLGVTSPGWMIYTHADLLYVTAHSADPGCEPTIENLRVFPEALTLTRLPEGQLITFDPRRFDCGRVQIDIENHRTKELYVGVVVNYGTKCEWPEEPPTPEPPTTPEPPQPPAPPTPPSPPEGPKEKKEACNQGVGNGPEECDPGNSNQGDPGNSNDENGGTPGNPGKKGGKK
jgi:hypothetical protein